MLIPRRSWVLLPLLAGCGDSPPLQTTLPDGVRVTVAADGSLALDVGNRRVFATARAHVPRVHAFTLDVQQSIGFYDLDRVGETVVPADHLDRAARVGDTVEVDYASDGGTRVRAVISAGPVPDSTRVRFEVRSAPAGHASLEVPLACDTEATFLGFGAQYGALDQRGEAFPLLSQEQGIGRGGLIWLIEGDAHTTYLPMPYFVDARGFGVVVQTDARVLVDLCQSDPEAATLDVEQAQPVDLVVLHGPRPKDVVRQVGDLYGRPAPLTDWALGPWIGVQGGQPAVLAEADALDAAAVPYTALWAQDWVGRRSFTANQFGVRYHWTVDATMYPDLVGLVDSLHTRGKRFLGYANPWVVQPEEHYAPMDAAGHLVQSPTGGTYVMTTASLQQGSLPDLSSAGARAYVAGYLDEMVGTYGMDGWMCDFGEALPLDAVLADGTPGMLAHNAYPGKWHALHRERLEAARPDGDFALFSRSGWLGTQGSAQIVWIGDQEANFGPLDGLPTVVPAMLNLGLSGVPFVTHDIAGFSGGPSTQELFARWTELGAFTLVMRTHEGLRRDENWDWNGGALATPTEAAATIAHFGRFARIHRALVPYLSELVDEASRTSVPPLRAMVLEFPDEPALRRIADQFMVGDQLLVAPVVEEGATSRTVVFPAGTWTHALRPNEVHVGPATVSIAAPIGEPAVFWRGTPRVDLSAIP